MEGFEPVRPATVAELLPQDGNAWLVPDAFAPAEADVLLERLRHGLAWEQAQARIMGRRIALPRLTAWYGAAGYRYSGVDHPPAPWPDDLLLVKARVEAVTGVTFAAVLANLYRDGRDGVGWHADDEPSLGPDPVIASVSLGAVRRFRLRHRRQRALTVALDLPHGSCLVMGKGVQRHWQHSLPKTRRPVACRINLTFRPGATG